MLGNTEVKTYRFCLQCKRNNFFIYNKLIGHSRCQTCQGQYSAPVDEIKEFKNKVLNILRSRKGLQNNREMEELIEKIERLGVGHDR